MVGSSTGVGASAGEGAGGLDEQDASAITDRQQAKRIGRLRGSRVGANVPDVPPKEQDGS